MPACFAAPWYVASGWGWWRALWTGLQFSAPPILHLVYCSTTSLPPTSPATSQLIHHGSLSENPFTTRYFAYHLKYLWGLCTLKVVTRPVMYILAGSLWFASKLHYWEIGESLLWLGGLAKALKWTILCLFSTAETLPWGVISNPKPILRGSLQCSLVSTWLDRCCKA